MFFWEIQRDNDLQWCARTVIEPILKSRVNGIMVVRMHPPVALLEIEVTPDVILGDHTKDVCRSVEGYLAKSAILASRTDDAGDYRF